MAKTKSVYICSSCGAESPKWQGKCPSCGGWNTYVEEVVSKAPSAGPVSAYVSGVERAGVKPKLMRNVTSEEAPRLDLHDGEFNRTLGGGLVRGSLVLIGGEPGIGKSTLVLQTVLKLKDLTILYVSGEESAQQLKLRAERLSDDLAALDNCFL
ncbi:MAG: AAA family ATPase, partial [Tannerella sp.]|nr:AAA family ATPase [Tannerella sp.]